MAASQNKRKTTKKNNSRNRSSSGRTASKKSNSRNTVSEGSSELLKREIIVWAAIAVGVILELCNFGVGKTAGNAIAGFFFGICGLWNYAFPVFLIAIVLFFVANPGNKTVFVKFIFAMIGSFMICAFIQLVSGPFEPSDGLLDYYTSSSLDRNGGGIIGGLITKLLCKPFGKPISFVVVLIILIICIVIVSEKSILKEIKKGGEKAYSKARDNVEYRNERHREIKEERQREYEARMERLAEEEQLSKENSFCIGDKDIQENSYDVSNQNYQKNNYSINNHKVYKDDYTENNHSSDNNGVFSMKQTELPGYKSYDNSQYNKPSDEITTIEIEEQLKDALNISKGEKSTNPSEKLYTFDNIPNDVEDSSDIGTSGNSRNGSSSNKKDVFIKLSGSDDYDVNGYIEPNQFIVNNDSDQEENTVINIKAPSTESKIKNSVTSSVDRKKRITKETRQETAEAVLEVEQEILDAESVVKEYEFPPIDLLTSSKRSRGMSSRTLQETADKLVNTLESFGVHTHLINVSCGPSVTRYELAPETGVKVSKIVSLADDIKLNLAASDIRIEAPIPGKAAVGIEVPNSENSTVTLRELIESEDFINSKSKIAFAVGLDLSGRTVIADIFKMPHLLIGGATGSGKSVCINTLIISILYKAKPDEVKFIMIDPKMIELNLYNGIPHLYIPVVTDPKKAAGALQWAVAEMTKRYTLFSALGVRDLKGYNAKIGTMNPDQNGMEYQKMPQIVIVVDEFADLMMVASGEVEEAVCRLAQLARAAGIHLILATQRPSVDVITGLIKANMPSRLALAVSSGVDSRTIIDMVGAEKLLGKGDMLFYPSGLPKPIRVQGAFVTEQEVERVVEFVKNQNGDAVYDEKVASEVDAHANARDIKKTNSDAAAQNEDDDGRDSYFKDAARFIVEKEKASIGSLQRVFKIGFNRAARIMDQLCEAGIVGEEEGTKPRKILMNMAQLESFLNPDLASEEYYEEGEEE